MFGTRNLKIWLTMCSFMLVLGAPAPGYIFSDAQGWGSGQYYMTIQMADVDGDGDDELLGRGAGGVWTYDFNTVSNWWGLLASTNPQWSDASGWSNEQYYMTIQTADVDGDGDHELLGRGGFGMETYDFDTAGNAWELVELNNPLWDDAQGWGSPQYYMTIQTADVDGDGDHELLARGSQGMWTYDFNTASGSWELLAFDELWSDASGWSNEQYYMTIQTADIDGDGADELLGRGAFGIETYHFNTAGNSWELVELNNPPWDDAQGWGSPQYYMTIQTADVDGDGDHELLARGSHGIWTHDFNTASGSWELLAFNAIWPDTWGWASPQYYMTIQTSDVDGDGDHELLGRGWLGTEMYNFNTAANSWEFVGSDPMFSDAAGWDQPQYYMTIQTGDIDGDDRDELVARGMWGIFAPGCLPIRNTTQGRSYFTIQPAIDEAVDDDEIEVPPGTYYESINFNGKAVTLRSSGGPEATTIDGNGAHSVVLCLSGEGAGTVLDGFTITGGGGSDNLGGGIYCLNSSPTVKNCTLNGNSAGAGGGMCNVNRSSPTVTNCKFTGNSAYYGGAMYNFYHSNPTVSGCLFYSNVTSQGQDGTHPGGDGGDAGHGGGMYNDNSSPIVSHCQFIENQTGSGGKGGIGRYGPAPGAGGNGGDGGRGAGMYNYLSSPTVTDCHFERNRASAGGIGGDGGYYYLTTPPGQGSGGDGGDGGSGAGMYNVGGSPVVADCSFSENEAGVGGVGGDGSPDGSSGSTGIGAGVFNENSNPNLTNCTFASNAGRHGGGMYNDGGSPTVLDCIFSANTAVNGGGIYNHYSNPMVLGCSFTGNWTANGQDYAQPRIGMHGNHGGSGGDGAGMYNDNSSPIVSSCEFIANRTGDGGKGQKGYDGGWWQSGGWGGNGGDGGRGAGMFNYSSSAAVTDCNFRLNVTGSGGDAGTGGSANGYCWEGDCHGGTGGIGGMGGAGAAMYNLNSSPVVTHCQFTDNRTGVGRNGGNGGDSEKYKYDFDKLSDFAFNHTVGDGGDGGHGGYGAAIYNESSSPAVTNCIFSGNVTADGGEGGHQGERPQEFIPLVGMVYKNMPGSASRGGDGGHGAGICNVSSEANVANCTFSDNLTGNGAPGGYGGDKTWGGCGYEDCGTPGIRGRGAGIYSADSSLTVSNCILWGDKPSEIDNVNSATTVTFSDVMGGQPDTGNIGDYPVFVNAAHGDLRLSGCSPCVDAGNNTATPLDTTDLDGDGDTAEPIPFDLAGNPRFMDDQGIPDTGLGVPPIVDMGAYERQSSTSTYPVRNVTKDATYCRIQMAIDDADDGDEIEVAPGTYYEAIDFKGKAVRLYSSGGPQVTTIDGTGYYHVVQCVSGEGPDTILEGFTVTGGNANGPEWPEDQAGGGMYNDNSSPTVTRCIFRGNSASSAGGGMYNRYSRATVTNCTFIANMAFAGGGMDNVGKQGTVGPTITNCTVSGNTATHGAGGISTGRQTTTITNCIIWGNKQPDMTIFFVIPTVTYSNVRGGYPIWFGVGCIDADPCFADADGRLSPGSPCIDRGDNGAVDVETDLEGKPRIMDGDADGFAVVDMGAYETRGLVHVPGDHATIQGAINDANDGDQIAVSPGIYNEAINFLGKAIRLYSSDGPEVTTINGNGAYHVVQCVSGEGPDTILEGFTITGGNANGSPPDHRGGGMYNQGSSPTVVNCTFTGNSALADGGGMSIYEWSNPTVTDCTFSGNSSSYQGGGLAIGWNCAATVSGCTFSGNVVTGAGTSNNGGGVAISFDKGTTLTNCVFVSNSASYKGGGMYLDLSAHFTKLINCTFTGNDAGAGGGGMYNKQSGPQITNCTFANNSSSQGSGGAMLTYYGGEQDKVTPNLTNCILWNNTPDQIVDTGTPAGASTTVTYSDVQGTWPGTGNIDQEPLFADADGRLSLGSPCIDAGDNYAVTVTTDLDGNWRIMDGDLVGDSVVDMGAYEYVSADTDADGIKDSVDTAPPVYSNDFADGSTTGTIIDRADQVLIIGNAPDPCGVWISASGGATPAQVSVCGWAAFALDDGDVAFVTCGSVQIAVVQGTVEVTFVAADGTQVVTSLNEGNSIAFEPGTCTITAPAANVDDVVVVVEGREIVLSPGESETLAQVDIDIEPEVCPNPINVGLDYPVPVAILGTESFDVSQIDPATVVLSREGVADVVAAVGWAYADVATPFEGEVCGCHTLGPDGFVDLKLEFGTMDLAKMLKLDEVVGQSVVLILDGNLRDEFGEIPTVGKDCVAVVARECWAVNVSMTTATLCGMVIDDGPWQYRFRYRKEGGADSFTPWSSGFKAVGESFCQDISGLNSGCKYHLWAEVRNSAGESDCVGPRSFTTLRGLLELEAPNGDATYLAGSRCLICWKADPTLGDRDVLVEYSTDNGSSWNTIDTVAIRDEWRSYIGGHYLWQAPAVTSTTCLVRISDTSDSSIFDVSEDTFSIVMQAVPDVVGLVQADAEAAITAASLAVGTISYSYDNAVAAGEVMGQYPAAGTPVAAGSAVDLAVSAGPFAVGPPAVETEDAVNIGASSATLRGVITDDGGGCCRYRFWYHQEGGDHYDVTPWSSEFKTAGESFSQDIDGLKPGTKYYFWAQVKNSAGESDRWGPSESFTTLEGLLQLEAPHGGTFSAGSRCLICWKADAAVSEVLVEYSTDNGGSWSVIDTVANGDEWRSCRGGHCTWQAPAVSSNECLIRISDASDPSIFDVSESTFRIVP